MEDHIKEFNEARPFFNTYDKWTNNKTGNLYTFVGLGWHSESLEVLVSYVDKEGGLWHRPWKLFLEKFTLTHPANKQSIGGIH